MNIIKNKLKLITIIIIVFALIIPFTCIFLYNQNSLTQTNNNWTHEAGQELLLNANDFFKDDEKKTTEITFDLSAVDQNTVGEYTAIANFKGKSFDINISVIDTTSPKVEFIHRYIFTNDIANTDFSNTFAGVYDSSEWSAKLIRFEKHSELRIMNENDLKELTKHILEPCNEEELKTIGTTEIPSEEGIYRAVLEIVDIYGNSTLKEVYVIYDTIGTCMNTIPDQTDFIITNNEERDSTENSALTEDESISYISPSEQAVIDAGYGVVIQIDSTTYSVLTQGDGFINGEDGGIYLINHLLSLGLEGTVSGCWISATNDWYRYIAENVHEIDTSENEWNNDGAIEFIN